MNFSKDVIQDFQELILTKGYDLYREMPWRLDTNPYYVFLSEIMLQQTQVSRVLVKFNEFITKFPNIKDLANAQFDEVLATWSGLGYNRRAKFLHTSAGIIQNTYNGVVPNSFSDLCTLPGIGPNTAASILVYAYNQPHVFVETNIRTVFIYTFFPDVTQKIKEKRIVQAVQQTLYTANPRQWYWALMDYGSYLKKTVGNYNKFSKSYTTQSKFEGSNRQKRAKILRLLLKHEKLLATEIAEKLSIDIALCTHLLDSLCKDSLIQKDAQYYRIAQ